MVREGAGTGGHAPYLRGPLRDKRESLGNGGSGIVTEKDDGWAEIIANTLPLVARTRNEEKRRRFALLLASAAAKGQVALLDEARTMALLLDQLEEGHVRLLHRIVSASEIEEMSDKVGRTRYARLDLIGYDPSTEAVPWIQLHSLGLLQGGADTIQGIYNSDLKASVIAVTDLGLRLQYWITEQPG